ncbi:IspD/TarI family cytidylyltransferase [Lachnospiraceae bacterium 29-91]
MNIALILSGGTGARMYSKIPKQYIEIRGMPIVKYCIDKLSLHNGIDAIQIVADLPWHDRIMKCLDKEEIRNKFRGFSAPGANRQLSIYQGLKDIKEYAEDSDYVLIHDAARPVISEALITRCLSAAAGHDGVMPVLPMKDTVYYSTDGVKVKSLLNRNEIYAGQAPELFQLGAYYEANKKLLPDQILRINGSTEPAIIAGLDIVMIPGEESNFKITTKSDLERFRKMIEETTL